MRTLIAAVVAVSSLAGTGFAAEPQACEIPGYLLFGNHELKRVEAIVNKDRRLTIAVVGTGSSILVGPDGSPPIRRGSRRRSSTGCPRPRSRL